MLTTGFDTWRDFPPDQKLRMLAKLRAQRVTAERIRFDRVPLYPKQAAIVDDLARFTICEASTKAGKSMSHLEWLLEVAIAKGFGEWWWVAPIYATSKMMFRRCTRRLQGYILSGSVYTRVGPAIPYTENKSELFIEVGGARIWFKGADNPDSLYGEDVQGAVGDEITRWKEESWHALYSTLSATGGPCKLIGNVKGRRNFAYKLARKAEAGEPGWGYHKLVATDAVAAGIMDASILASARRDLPEAVYKELYEAEASDDQGNPFGFAAIKACIGKRSDKATRSMGWDLAKSVDWTWGVGLDADGAQTVSERFQSSWELTIERIVRVTGRVPSLVDSTGVGDPIVENLQKKARNVFTGYKFTSPSKQQLMEALAVSIQQGELTIYDPLLINELNDFEFQYTRTGCKYSAPEGAHDDGVCALALANYHRSRARTSGDLGVTV